MQLVTTYIECPNCKKWYTYTPFSLYTDITTKNNLFPLTHYLRCSSCEDLFLLNDCRLRSDLPAKDSSLYKEILRTYPEFSKGIPLPFIDCYNFMEIGYSHYSGLDIIIEEFIADYLTLIDKLSKRNSLDELFIRADLWKLFSILEQKENSFIKIWKNNYFPLNIKLILSPKFHNKMRNLSVIKKSMLLKYHQIKVDNESLLQSILKHKNIQENKDIELILRQLEDTIKKS